MNETLETQTFEHLTTSMPTPQLYAQQTHITQPNGKTDTHKTDRYRSDSAQTVAAPLYAAQPHATQPHAAQQDTDRPSESDSPHSEAPIPKAIQEVIDLFQNQLQSVPFPDVSVTSLLQHQEEVRSRCLEVRSAQQTLDRARATLADAQHAMKDHAQRAADYLKVYATGNEALSSKVSALQLGKASKPNSTRKRRRKKEPLSDATPESRTKSLPFDEQSAGTQSSVDELQ